MDATQANVMERDRISYLLTKAQAFLTGNKPVVLPNMMTTLNSKERTAA